MALPPPLTYAHCAAYDRVSNTTLAVLLLFGVVRRPRPTTCPQLMFRGVAKHPRLFMFRGSKYFGVSRNLDSKSLAKEPF
jgi:hypothetical protein